MHAETGEIMSELRQVDTTSKKGARTLLLLMVLVSTAAFLEGFDGQIQGYTAPVLIRLWHIHKSAFGPVFVLFQLGFLLGALGLGNLGDIVGRRRVIIVNVLLFGLFTIAGGFTANVATLAATRFLSALFLGGTIPNAIALLIDYSPTTRRALGVSVMYVIYALGGSSGGFASAVLVPTLGWQSVYWICGAVAIAYSGVLYLYLPESIYFMHAGATLPPADAAPRKGKTAWVGQLFANHRGVMTIALWAAFCGSQIALQFSNSWMPTILSGAGLSYGRSVVSSALFQGGGAVGSVVCGWLLGRPGGIRWLFALSLGAVPVLIGIGHAVAVPWLLTSLACGAGFCIIGSQTGLNASAGFLYPANMRSTGAGWANGVGRVGAMCGPALGAALISLEMPIATVFLVASIPSFTVSLLALAVHATNPAKD